MALSPGTRLGPYEITAQIGAGGMGEVYRARDTKLDRPVAIKILPESFAHDSERLARFEREAKTLAALNHPNIAIIHGFEEAQGIQALVMELVEGPTLADRIARGPLPIEEALAIARQIAEALEAAHDKGIIHRDLKPANIALTANDQVKVLDFGLAKFAEPQGAASSDPSASPTITSPAMMTGIGMILGTAAYMSPEQAKGKPADKRSDIWAFGCVLFEMLTGKRTFAGDDVSDTFVAIMRDEPDWTGLPAATPPFLRTLLRRCLQKDPRKRLPDIGAARLELEEGARDTSAGASPAVEKSGTRTSLLPWAIVAALTLSLAGSLIWARPWRSSAALPLVRFPIALPPDQTFTRPQDSELAISPDGSRIVYVADRALRIRALSEFDAHPIPGTGSNPYSPVFSPDGNWIVYISGTDGALRRIALEGGTPVTLTNAPAAVNSVTWSGNDLYYSVVGMGISRVSADGGTPEVVAKVDEPEAAFGPQVIGDVLLYSVANDTTRERWDRASIVAQRLPSGERTVIIRGGSDARYVPTGHLLYATSGSLYAIRFDPARLATVGKPQLVLEGVARTTQPATRGGVAQYAVAANGTLVYVPGPPAGAFGISNTLALVDFDGTVHPLDLQPRSYTHPRISPDGSQLTVATEDDGNISIYDMRARTPLRQLTFEGRNNFPIWTPDGAFVTFQSDREKDRAIYRVPADGSKPAERLTKPESSAGHEPESWSPDGKTLSFDLVQAGQGVWMMSMEGERTVTRFADDGSEVEKHSTFSPNGRWVAYMMSGPDTQVYVEPFPRTSAKYKIPFGPSRTPAWAPDGQRLFFHAPSTNLLMMVDVRSIGAGLSFGPPRPISLEGTVHPQQQRNYDVMPDGKQLIVVLPAKRGAGGPGRYAESGPQQVNVVLNWFEELKRLVPTR